MLEIFLLSVCAVITATVTAFKTPTSAVTNYRLKKYTEEDPPNYLCSLFNCFSNVPSTPSEETLSILSFHYHLLILISLVNLERQILTIDIIIL